MKHTISWSKRAREIADMQAEYVEDGWALIHDVTNFIPTMEENPIIKQRVAKRFGRMVRSGKVKDNIDLYNYHYGH